jgi:hypothetical protein
MEHLLRASVNAILNAGIEKRAAFHGIEATPPALGAMVI